MIDLRSDTVTRPTREMRQAMAEAEVEVGDDVYREAPTVNRLQERAAERLGMEAALFVPSGTMANAVGERTVRLLTHRDVSRADCLSGCEAIRALLSA